MKLYVAGPMTGYEHYNVAAFEDARCTLELAGHDTETPFEANSRVWMKHHGRAFDPFTDRCDYGDPILPEMFLEDLATLAAADGIALLPGWEKSRGASLEFLIAQMFGKPAFCAVTMEPITLAARVTLRK